MSTKQRTRPRRDRPERTNVTAPCCKPFPDARFKDERLVDLWAHHNGPGCNGYMEPMSVEDWNAEIDRRSAAARSRDGGDDR